MSDAHDNSDDAPVPGDPVTEELVAYLDGELDILDAQAVAAKLSSNPALRAEADGLKRAWDVLDVLPKPRPSAEFSAKTVSQIVPVRPATTVAVTMAAMPVFPARNRTWWPVAAGLVVVGGLAGYFGRGALVSPPDGRAKDAEMIGELSLLKNARLYRHVDDMDYLRRLDTPELFAEDDHGARP